MAGFIYCMAVNQYITFRVPMSKIHKLTLRPLPAPALPFPTTPPPAWKNAMGIVQEPLWALSQIP